MELNVRETAKLMGVSEKTIYRWIKHNKLPAFKINDQYRFSRVEMLEWATSQRINVSAELLFDSREKKATVSSLEEALRAGGIHYRVGGAEKSAALRSIVEIMPLPPEVDKAFLLRVLIARESLGSTSIGDGIAIPHVRNPIVLHVPRPILALCFMEHAIEFGALDGKPVHTLFAIVSPTVTAHLNLLSRLAFALRHPVFSKHIAQQGSRDEILESAREIDRLLLSRVPENAAAGGGSP